MASVTSSTASSDSASESSSNQPTSQTTSPFQGFVKNGNGVCDDGVVQEKPTVVDPFQDMDSQEYIGRFRKLEADFTARLMSKYFSDKDVYGDDIFDKSVTVDGETIKSGRFHCAQSYADPAQYLIDKSSKSSAPPAAINRDDSSTPPPANNA